MGFTIYEGISNVTFIFGGVCFLIVWCSVLFIAPVLLPAARVHVRVPAPSGHCHGIHRWNRFLARAQLFRTPPPCRWHAPCRWRVCSVKDKGEVSWSMGAFALDWARLLFNFGWSKFHYWYVNIPQETESEQEGGAIHTKVTRHEANGC